MGLRANSSIGVAAHQCGGRVDARVAIARHEPGIERTLRAHRPAQQRPAHLHHIAAGIDIDLAFGHAHALVMPPLGPHPESRILAVGPQAALACTVLQAMVEHCPGGLLGADICPAFRCHLAGF